MTDTDTLLPCPVPWCGSDVLEVVRSPWSRGYCITCQSCGVQSPSRETEAEATAAWNRRTTPTPVTDEREAVARAISTKTFAYCIGGSGDCGDWEEMDTRATDIYLNAADAALSALAPIRAAEILAAEANERARALGQAAEHINRLEAALRGLLSTVERLDISEGVCCCGDDMATHAEPMSCGHTPVDAGHYHHGNAIQQARDAIEHGAGK